jgi:hypothetical protein
MPDVSSEQRAATETAKLIRKLRWIGNEHDAQTMERQMMNLPPMNVVSVLADPLVTD